MSQISNKPFTTAEDQVKILERRGVICDERVKKYAVPALTEPENKGV